MCFAPQRRAHFQHLNFQKWSDAEVFCTFSLRNRLRATTACNFSSLISPDVSAPAALASLLFNPPEPQNHEKTQCFATFLPFRAPASSFFWSFLFWLFSLLTAFSSLHIVGSLTSKLPSNIQTPWYRSQGIAYQEALVQCECQGNTHQQTGINLKSGCSQPCVEHKGVKRFQAESPHYIELRP